MEAAPKSKKRTKQEAKRILNKRKRDGRKVAKAVNKYTNAVEARSQNYQQQCKGTTKTEQNDLQQQYNEVGNAEAQIKRLFEGDGVWEEKKDQILSYAHLKALIQYKDSAKFQSTLLKSLKSPFIGRLGCRDADLEAAKIMCACLSMVTDQEFGSEIVPYTEAKFTFGRLIGSHLYAGNVEVKNDIETFLTRFEPTSDIFKVTKLPENTPISENINV